MTRLRSLIKEVLSQPKKKDCNCGCNDCGGKAPILTEGKVKHLISEGLQYHMDKKIQLHESVYRIGSEKHFELIREARALWVRGIIDVSEDDQAILETHLGNFEMYEGEAVPLDMPMVNEDMNDPVLVKARAAKISAEKEKAKQAELDKKYGSSYNDKLSAEIDLKQELQDLKDEREQLMIDMEQEAEPEGGEIADRYGSRLNDIDARMAEIKSELDDLRMYESLNEVDRYSGFNRNPEDPDSVPFEPKGSVAQFREELRALFGKFKGDLKNPEFIKGVAEIMVNWKSLLRSQLDEAKKKSKSKKKDPPIGKPKRGGPKAYYVYVRDPKTKRIKKVTFGSGGLRAKIRNPKARNAFAKRHRCSEKNDRTKASYWSCRLPRYAKQLGLGSNMNTFW